MPNKGNVPPLVRVCVHCGVEYRAWPYEAAKGRKYCGYSCRSKARAAPLEARFWAKTRPWEDCLIWTDTYTRGRPRFNVGGGRIAQAPRFAYELTFGPAPAGAHVRHTCGHTFCVNPAHLAVAFDPAIPLAERFWGKVQLGEGCWLWTRGHDEHGAYGITSVAGRRVRAHRLAWELTYGAIPRGLFVCHRCDVPPCVRPDHLFLGTPLENMRDMWAKGRGSDPPVRCGEANNKSRFTQEQVWDMRQRAAAGESHRAIARVYATSHAAVGAIVRREVWKHVP